MRANARLAVALIAAALIAGCTQQRASENEPAGGESAPATKSAASDAEAEGETKAAKPAASGPPDLKLATFGGGCFWCVEAVFQRLDGVEKVVSGYSGGHVENPTYEQICTKTTGHIEVCQITWDAARVEFVDLLEVFFATHDPTTLDRQGNDVGPQYRSVVFYHDEDQKRIAEGYKKGLDEEGVYDDPIVTEIRAAEKFWPAEDYHQNYFNTNPSQPYCVYVVGPKVKKLKEKFSERLKKKGAD